MDKNKKYNRVFAPTVKVSSSPDPVQFMGKHLQIIREDLEISPGLKEIVLREASFIDTIMEAYYVHAGNKYCPWIAMQIPDHRYVNINIDVS